MSDLFVMDGLELLGVKIFVFNIFLIKLFWFDYYFDIL